MNSRILFHTFAYYLSRSMHLCMDFFYMIEINWILRCNKLNFMLKKFEQNLSLKYFFCSVFSNKMNALHTHILNRTYSPYEWLLYVSWASFQAEIWWQIHAVPTRPEPHFFYFLYEFISHAQQLFNLFIYRLQLSDCSI